MKESIESAKSRPTYFSAFIFQGFPDPEVLHVTHKYFADQTPESAAEIEEIMDEFFASPKKFPRAVFSEQQMFGPDKDVRVLTPKSVDLKAWFPELRDSLEKFKKDEHGEYKPHVTTDEDLIDLPFAGYGLMYDGKIIRYYPNEALAADVMAQAPEEPDTSPQEDKWDSEFEEDVDAMLRRRWPDGPKD